YHALAIDVPQLQDGTPDYVTLELLLRQMNSAASVTLTDALPNAPDSLVALIRYNGSVYLTDAVNPQGRGSSAEARAAARGIGHSRIVNTPQERHSGLPAWSLSGNQMRTSAALIPLMPDQAWRDRSKINLENPDLRIIPTRGTGVPVKFAHTLLKEPSTLEERVVQKHVYMGDSSNGALAMFAKLHTAMASGNILEQPTWGQSASLLMIAVAAFALVSSLWRESRRMIISATLTLTMVLLVTQWALANQLHLQLDLLRPWLSVFVGCLACFWMTPDRNSQRRESFRAGLRYLRTGKLDAAFQVFRHCPPHPSLMPTLYKLAIAFEKQGQTEQSRAVFAYMAGKDKRQRKKKSDPTQRMPAAARKNIPDAIPETLGRYEVLRPLGNGAMGGVFLGRDPRINRLIALKIISFAAYNDEAERVEMRARFFQEAESAGRLTHPGITAVYDSGEQNDIGYIALEYAPGQQMTEFTKRDHLLDPATVLRLMTAVAEALDYAHSEHVVHRDIKPANLIYDPDAKTIKITDFGVAKLVDSERTRTGIILGTPSYMSPEQSGGEALTGSSDLFSLGVTLYELLAGDVPFRGQTIAELMTAINKKTPQPLTALRQDLPPAIDAIIERALAKQPANRFATGSDMAFALRECTSQLFNRAVNVQAVNQ
ncbi:MAG: serine/threonine-protein kinase, partial [Pseudomonadota bacterium]